MKSSFIGFMMELFWAATIHVNDVMIGPNVQYD